MSRVSIITRTLDRPVLLERTLRSIIAQTFADWQWVIVNSGQASPVEDLLKTHAGGLEGRAVHLPSHNPKPGMRGAAINAGIEASDGDLIVVLDDDDTWDPAFLARMVAALDARPHPNIRGVVCRTKVIEETSVEDGLKPTREYELNPELWNVTLANMAVVNRFCVHAFLYERSALEEVGLYPEDYPVLEDWHFNLRFLLKHDVCVVPEVLTNYHIRQPEIRGAEANSQTAEKADHKYFEARLINEAIRQDLQDGKAGLGHLLAQAAMSRQITDSIHKIESRLKTISEKTGKIDDRTKKMKDRLGGKP